ncbi:MAG: hypothetical protein Q4C46_03185 [Bacillota bacterium]|nr:hypothetical protein [Bacillota bacterium]
MASEKQMKCSAAGNGPDTFECGKCRCRLEPAGVRFAYLGSRFALEALRCPECGQIYISEALVDGRIHATESFLEDRKMFQSN